MNGHTRFRPYFWLMLSLLAASIAWLYMTRVLAPWEQYFNVDAGTMKAALGDLYSPWYGTRALLWEGKNPYGSAVTHEIQLAFYGHAVQPTTQSGVRPTDEQRFAYPVYVVLLLAPLAHVDFATAHAWAVWLLGVAAALGILVWMEFAGWRSPWASTVAIVLFMLASPQFAQGLRLRQLGLLVTIFLALAAWLARRNRLFVAGLVLALATIKPQMALLPIVWMMIWSLGSWRKRWPLPAGLLTGLVVLFAAGERILPGWPREFLAGLAAYRRYGPVTTSLQLLLGNTAGVVFSALIVLAVLVWGWRQRECEAESADFASGLAAFLTVASVALPLMPPFNQTLLVLPVLMLLQQWRSLSNAACILFAVIVGWPCVAQLALLIFPPATRSLAPLPLLPSALVLLFPPFLLLWLALRRNPVAI